MKRFNALAAKSETVVATPKRGKTAATPAAAPNFRQAATLLRSYTGHTGNFWRLAGPSYVEQWVQIMSALLGKRVPKKAAGLTVIADLFYEHIGANAWTFTCQSDKDAKFRTWLNAYCEGKAPETNVPTPECETVVIAPTPPVRYGNALAAAAARVPAGTFAFLAGQAAIAGEGESIRARFTAWCEEHSARFTDWRKAWDAYAAAQSNPTNIIPFTTGHGDAEPAAIAPVAVDPCPIDAALAAFA